jgi:carboxymethylenebutenolidase
LQPNFAAAQIIPKDDARVKTETITIASPDGSGSIKAYVAKPANASGKLPAVLVIHENRGLNPHIEDITRRIALDGYVAIAPDALTALGGYPGDEDKARTEFAKLDQAKIRQDFLASYAAIKARADVTAKVGAVGFCYGGGIVHFLSTRLPDLAAGVPFYGNHPTVEEAAKVKAPLQIHFAGIDERINAAWPGYEAGLKAGGAKYEAHIYAGTQHGFNNDTTPRFDTAAAKLAWERTMGFFKARLA